MSVPFHARTHVAAVVAVIAAAVGGAGAAAARAVRGPVAHAAGRCAGANTPATRAPRRSMQAAVLCLVNLERRRRGLPPLREDRRLDRSAQRWTNAMVSHDIFTHGSDFAARISAAGFRWSAAGENIATGFLTPRQVLRAWMGSEGHCRNILDPDYTRLGTGVARRPVRGYAGGPATWTQDFALPIGARARSSNWGPADRCPY